MKTALIVVDMQNDFVPGGSLPVKEGDKIVPLINQLVKMNFDFKAATKDWHPSDHESFAIIHHKKPGEKIDLHGLEQILWPVHCVQHSPGSDFVPGLDTTQFEQVFYKGTDRTIDSYSTFFDNGRKKRTKLDEFLKERSITDLYFAGLATDYCVKYSVMDALALGYKVHVIVDACRGVNLEKNDSTNALEKMKAAGAELIHFRDLVAMLSKMPKT